MSDSKEDPWAWMTPEKAKRLSKFGKLDGTMETAKDILERHRRTGAVNVPLEDALRAMQEIADKAWEAGRKREYMNCKGLKYHTPPPTKKKFMKSLFPLKEI